MSKTTFCNKLVKNIKSPRNESKRIKAYKNLCDLGDKHHGDISSVITKDGTKGMAILPKHVNRSRDTKKWYRGKKFIPNNMIDKILKKKK